MTAPIDPGPGYRLLEDGELVTCAHEYHSGFTGWIKVPPSDLPDGPIKHVVGVHRPTRIKIPTPAPTEPPEHESDPHGTDPHAPGAKLDAGKVRPWLVIKGFQNALLEVSKVGTFGAAKYNDNGWRSVPDGINRYADAMGRHLLADGLDGQSRLSHLAHAAWNLLALIELELAEAKASE